MTAIDADVVIIGAGPAGAAAAITAARSGARVVVLEKSLYGRDKVCGDGLTPRAISALDDLGVDHSMAHRIDGLRMTTTRASRELLWPTDGPFAQHGAVWPRNRFDAHLMSVAQESGALIYFGQKATPVFEENRVVGARSDSVTVRAGMTVLAAGAQGEAAEMLGAVRDRSQPFGLAIRAYAPSSRHAERYLEACLSLSDEYGVAIPGYGWIFPAGDGTVNIGVGALSTMRGFSKLNLNRLIGLYAASVRESWGLEDFVERPRAWRLPMSVQKRSGPGWVAVGDAAGLVNPMNGEGIDYGLESGVLAASLFVKNPSLAPSAYDDVLSSRYDPFLRTGRRFSYLIGHPWILRAGLRMSLSSDRVAQVTLQVMGNLVDPSSAGTPRRVLAVADKTLKIMDPVLRVLAPGDR